MKSTRLAIFILVAIGACGGLAVSNNGDAGGPDGRASRPDSNSGDGGGSHDGALRDGASTDGTTSCGPGESPCDGVCVDQETDSKNCGGCGLTCDAPCVRGRCVSTIVAGRELPVAIAVDSSAVYWANAGSCGELRPSLGILECFVPDGTVTRMPKGGGTPVTLASKQDVPSAIALDDSNVYWLDVPFVSSTAFVMAVPKLGGTPRTLASVMASPLSIAVDDLRVYWTNSLGCSDADGSTYCADTRGSVMSVPKGGGTPTTLASLRLGPSGIATDGTSVYWLDGDGVMNVPVGGGTVTTLVASHNYSGNVAVDEKNVYWAGARSILSVPKAGGSPTTVASGQCNPFGIVADSTSIYWESPGCMDAGTPYPTVNDVTSISKVGGAASMLVTLVTSSYAGSLAVDSTSLYWPDYHCANDGGLCSGTVRRLTPK